MPHFKQTKLYPMQILNKGVEHTRNIVALCRYLRTIPMSYIHIEDFKCPNITLWKLLCLLCYFLPTCQHILNGSMPFSSLSTSDKNTKITTLIILYKSYFKSCYVLYIQYDTESYTGKVPIFGSTTTSL